MKRLLRVTLMGPLMVLMALLLTLGYPVWRFTFWLADDPPPDKGMVREMWRELVWDLW